MVIGVFDLEAHAETALNNLSEAEFDLQRIEVLAQDPAMVKALKGNQDLTKLPELPKDFENYLNQGKIVIVINTSSESQSAAEEILQDSQALITKVI